MKFYLKRIVKLDQEKNLTEALGPDKFGTLIHEVLEYAETKILPRICNAEDYEKLKPLINQLIKNNFVKLFPNQSFETGLNYALIGVAETILNNYIEHRINKVNFPMENLVSEIELKHKLQINLPDKNIFALITGRLDKVEITEKQLRIIDYKTGKVEPKDLIFKKDKTAEEEISIIEKDEKSGYLRQLWLYQYLLQKNITKNGQISLNNEIVNIGDNELVAGIYSFRNMKDGFMKGITMFREGADFMEISERILSNIIAEMMENEQKITRTDNLNTCKSCGYNNICQRT